MLKEFIRYVSFNILSMLGISIYVLCDTYFIANGIGTDALSGLNLVLPYFSLISAVGLMVGMGTATRYSILRGSKREGEAKDIIIHGILLSLLFGTVFSIFGYACTKEIVEFMGADSTLFPYAKDYIGTIFLFAWAIIVNNLIICISRGAGYPKLAMIAAFIGSGSNLLLDIVFIYGLKMGNFGAALASGISPCFAIAFQVYHFVTGDKKFDFNLCKIKLKKLFDICGLGFASFVTEFATGLVMACFNFIILKQAGNIGIAAYSVIANISFVASAMFTGIAQGIQPLVSFNYGAGKMACVRQFSRYAYITSTVMSLSVYSLFYFYSQEIINAFNKDNNLELVQMADTGIKTYFLCLFFMGANIVTTSILASKARSWRSFMLSVSRAGLIAIPLLFVLSKSFGLVGTWLTIPVTEFITMLIFLF